MNNLCGNVLEVQNTKGEKLCVMSTKAYVAFTEAQKKKILSNVDQIVHEDVNIIETVGGGGVRCMMAELF